jgi:hypothetical protein
MGRAAAHQKDKTRKGAQPREIGRKYSGRLKTVKVYWAHAEKPIRRKNRAKYARFLTARKPKKLLGVVKNWRAIRDFRPVDVAAQGRSKTQIFSRTSLLL